MAAKTEERVMGLFDQALETFEGALQTGIKMQNDVFKWWSEALDEGGAMAGWQERWQAVYGGAVPAVRRQAEEYVQLMDQTARSGLDLMKQAFEAAQAESISAAQAKTQQFWESALAATRSNTQAMVQANARAMEGWSRFIRRGMDETLAASRA